MKLYQKIAQTIQAMENCEKSGNTEWYNKHKSDATRIERIYFPSGSGFDGLCGLLLDNCTKDKLHIFFEWHCMNDNGYYDGWLQFDLIITPSFDNFDMKIKFYGNDNNKHKVTKYKPLLSDFFYDTWDSILNQEYKEGR